MTEQREGSPPKTPVRLVRLSLVSEEHPDREQPRDATLRRLLFAKDDHHRAPGFAWLRTEASPTQPAVDLMVRQGLSGVGWRAPRPGERLAVSGWLLGVADVLTLGPDVAALRQWSLAAAPPDLSLWLDARPGSVISTVEDLKELRESLGLHGDEVGRAEDFEARRDEGAVLFRKRWRGRCERFTMGRGDTRDFRTYLDELAAVQDYAAQLLRRTP